MFKRILKTIAALGAGHGIQTLTQLLVPPVFIAVYGVNGYGKWLVLSAAVGYLGTLDFGLQTYVLNELTALYHRNEMEQFHRVQSVGLWLMLFFIGFGVLVSTLAFILPVANLLKLPGNPTAIAWTVFCLSLQILASIPMGQVVGIYRTCGEAHRGVMWGNLYRLLLVLVTLALAGARAPFWAIATGQVVTILAVLLSVCLTLHRSRPVVCPRLNYWDFTLAWRILKPSAFFGLFVLNNFLVYQAPVLMLQQFLGSEVVVAFSVARMLFSFVRQGAAMVQQSIGPEVTRLSGVGDKEALVRLYVLFEGVVLTVVLIINTGLLLASPLLLRLWLKRPQLFDFGLFLSVMLIAIVSSVKEYKVYFQYATNQHENTGLATFLLYLAMIGASYLSIRSFGVIGFTSVWLSVEVLQLGLVHFYNLKFFEGRQEISLRRAFRLALLLAVTVAGSFSIRTLLQSEHYLLQGALACVVMVTFAAFSYFVFGLREVLQEGRGQLLKLRVAC